MKKPKRKIDPNQIELFPRWESMDYITTWQTPREESFFGEIKMNWWLKDDAYWNEMCGAQLSCHTPYEVIPPSIILTPRINFVGLWDDAIRRAGEEGG